MDALALRGDEGRGKLRKAAVRSKHPLTRRFPNGGTHMSTTHVLPSEYIGRQGEPGEVNHLSTPRKRKQTSDSVSSGERTRNSLNRWGMLQRGRGTEVRSYKSSG